jgi:hypothetical protein
VAKKTSAAMVGKGQQLSILMTSMWMTQVGKLFLWVLWQGFSITWIQMGSASML